MAIVISGVKWPQPENKAEGILSTTGNYVTGGYQVKAKDFGMGQINRVEVLPQGGYSFAVVYNDVFTAHILVFESASGTTGGTIATNNTSAVTGTGTGSGTLSTITGEVVAVTAGTGVSAAVVGAPTAVFDSVAVTASGIGAFIAVVVPSGVTPATGQVGINYTTGVMQFLIADAVTSATVDYVQRAVPVTVSSLTATAAAQIQVIHTHTIGASGGGEYPNATPLTLTDIEFTVYGY